ncbi:hypothetical protein EIP86_000870 [Pleurotus ostreatoroseus]|nr:hypothetical protein EIP86_000870 [Pleurotus ostreatoroseus]
MSPATSKTSARATKLGRLLTTNDKSTSRKRRRASTPTPSHPFDAPSEALTAAAEPISTGLLTPAPSQDWQMNVGDGETSTVTDGAQTTQPEPVPETASARRTRARCLSSATEKAFRATRLRAKSRTSGSASAGDAQTFGADHGAQAGPEILSETPTVRPRKRRRLQPEDDAHPGAGSSPPPTQEDPFTLGEDAEQMDIAYPDDGVPPPPLHENPPVSTPHDDVDEPPQTHTRSSSEPEPDLENEPSPCADADIQSNRPRADGPDTSIPKSPAHHPAPDPDFVQPPGQRKSQDIGIENARTPPPHQSPTPSTTRHRPRPSPTRPPSIPQDRYEEPGSESGPRLAGVRPRSPHAYDCAGAGAGVEEAAGGPPVEDAVLDEHADEDHDQDTDSPIEPDVASDLHSASHPDALEPHPDPDLDLDQMHDFQLLDVLDAAALPWVRTDLPRGPGTDAPPEIESFALYLPPGVHQLIEAMKHALHTACAARTRAEARCTQAMQAHLAAEQRVCELEAACAALANERRLMHAAAPWGGASLLYESQTAQTNGGGEDRDQPALAHASEPSTLAGFTGTSANAYSALAGTHSDAYADPSANAGTEAEAQSTAPRPSQPSPDIRSQPKGAYEPKGKGKGKMRVPSPPPPVQLGGHTQAVLARAAGASPPL